MKHVAELAKKYSNDGNEVVLVTSALSGVTDALLKKRKRCLRDWKNIIGKGIHS